MRKIFAFLTIIAALYTFPVMAAPEIGKPAPDFTVTDINGKEVTLSALKGKPVVLEWTNPECPYVHKHYDSGNMQKTQATAIEKGAHWISINSSAEGRQGNLTADKAKEIVAQNKAVPENYVLDADGKIGKLYDAKTTPHMFVVDKDGNLAYAGAIDDNPSPKAEDAATAKNYVLTAIDELNAGTPVSMPTTQSYGCAVKYAD